MPEGRITVFLADDNLIVREGVRALLSIADDIEVIGVAGDYDELVKGAGEMAPQVIVTDIRMPPNFSSEGIDAAREMRKLHPGTGVVVLSQFDEPEYAVSLLADGAAGCAYLLKDRVAEGDQLVRAIREVTTGGSVLDPRIVEAMMRPVTQSGGLSDADEELLRMVAEGRTIKAIAAAQKTTAAAVSEAVERLFLKLAQEATAGTKGALDRLKMLHRAVIDGKEQGESLSRLLPGGIAEKVRQQGKRIGETERLTVTVVMSDIRGYSTIAEGADPSVLAGQINQHRAAMNGAILSNGGTIMQFVGDAVMAVYGAPNPQEDHADKALSGSLAMHAAQHELNSRWETESLPAFGVGIGISTGEVAAALLGSEERLEYTVVGDSVNLAQRIQQWAGPGEIVLSQATFEMLTVKVDCEELPQQQVKGRNAPVGGYRVAAREPIGA
ncbi:MAG TPA: adenylate/guanylate cyclase domain-containing protein [Candidatus Dormibacteraeota bacterium]|jgi:class 3 adenylate cyclase|nr:adenylate/guanylate cyclase domain-containing protein [Candidatus Dormibacteraeota bacterium]